MSAAMIVSWYLCGAWAAAWMVQRGHSPVPWWVAAALGGALVWFAALPVSRRVGCTVRWASPLPEGFPTTVPGEVVVGVVDDDGCVPAAAQALAGPDDLVIGLRPVGHEATGRLVDTGELDRASRALDVATHRVDGLVPRVGSGPLVDLVSAAAAPHRPSVVVRGPLSTAWRHDLRRSLELGAAADCPVLHVPGAADRSRVPRSAVGSAA